MSSDYSTKFRPERLRRLIDEGKTAREIICECGISMHTLKEHLELLNKIDKKEYTIKGLKEYDEDCKNLVRRRRGKVCAFNSRCNPDFRFADAFELEKSEERIIFKKVH